MAGEINRVPAGLLSILDMKARGQSPRNLSETMLGTLDLLDLYLQQSRGTFTGTIGQPAAPANVTTLAIPQNEIWYVHNISVNGGTAAALTSARFAPSIARTTITGSANVEVLGAQSSFAAGERPYYGWKGPWILRPGDTPGLAFAQTALGTSLTIILSLDRTIITL